MSRDRNPLVGRAVELSSLQAALDAVCRGEPRVVGLVGEPGIGKTRLLDELSARATARGAVVGLARAGELERDAPLGVASELIDAHHPQGSFYFLQFVGVLPDRQGRGIGSALLTHVLARCDEEGVPAYLDATSRRNKALYERHGFRTIGEYGPAWGPPLWQMWREPAG